MEKANSKDAGQSPAPKAPVAKAKAKMKAIELAHPTDQQFIDEYKKARQDFENQDYASAATKASELLKKILVDIIDKNHRKLSNSIPGFLEQVAGILNQGDDLRNVQLIDLCLLYDDNTLKILDKANNRFKEFSTLLRATRFEYLAQMEDFCRNFRGGEKEMGVVALGVQEILTTIAKLMLAHLDSFRVSDYHLLVNYLKISLEFEQIKESYNKLNPVNRDVGYVPKEQDDNTKKTFEWIKLRGMLVNTGDKSRNISFKVATFVNLVSSIYHGVIEKAGQLIPATGGGAVSHKSLRKITKSILFDAGYECGAEFGMAMLDIFQQKKRQLSLKEKIREWCIFDSDVGFGLLALENNEIYSEDCPVSPKDKKGHSFKLRKFSIKLSDNFIVYKMEKTDINLCSFVAGYIVGVLEKVSGQPLLITHNSSMCEQYLDDQKFCLFQLTTNVEVLRAMLTDAAELTSDDIQQEQEMQQHLLQGSSAKTKAQRAPQANS